MLNCAKVTGSADSRLNLKITAAEPSPVEELPSSISSRPNRATGARHSRKIIKFWWRWYTATWWARTSIFEGEPPVTTVSSPLESYVTSQQEQIKCQILKVEAIQRKIDAYKGERTPTAVMSSLPVCSKCHWREGHNRWNCPYPLSCSSSVYWKNISKHPEEKISPQGTHQAGNWRG